MSQPACFHCGLPLPSASEALSEWDVVIDGKPQAMCCAGCAAVARAIVDNGLADYYRTRAALPASPREARPALLDTLSLFDHAEFQKTFVRERAPYEREAALVLEGITCSACVWLNEQHIAALPGVLAVEINYATRRARVCWDERQIRLSEILKAVQSIGYQAHPYDPEKTDQLARQERRAALWRVWVAGFGMMQVMMYAFPAYVAAEGELTSDIGSLMRWASLILTLPVVFYSAAPFFRHAWRDIGLRRVGMDVPVALGVGAAFLASVWATISASGEVYFDSVTMFVFFLLGGRYLEMVARQKAVSVTEALARLQPVFAERLLHFPQNRMVEQVMVSLLLPGDVLQVRPGAVIPVDGVVIEGNSHADESLLTGESRPVPKSEGDWLTGGSVNVASPVLMRVSKVGAETRLSAIVRLMERAGLEKPRLVALADRVASRFVAVLLVLAAMVGAVWYTIDPTQALWITVSVLVVTCPCALSLATPIALTVSAGALAKKGLLVTRGHAIETLARATHLVFDKTGTLTTGQMRCLEIRQVVDAKGSPEASLQLAAALERASEHPIAHALRLAVEAPEAGGEGTEEAVDIQAMPGQGLEGWIGGVCYRVGTPVFVSGLSGGDGRVVPEAWLTTGDTVVALGNAEGVLALFRIGDALRSEAKQLIQEAGAMGLSVILLSGDSDAVVKHVAEALGIHDARADLSPGDKHAAVVALQAEGAVVAMVGDGVNDAPVLAQAEVSIAMGGGAALARTQADVVLLSDDLAHLGYGLKRARLTIQVIRQNLGWAFAYNLVALPLAMLGYVTPWIAGVGMSLSSLLVVLNSLRIQRKEIV